jgi:hypothetical protein
VQLVDPASRTTALPVGGGVVRGEDGLLRSNGRSQRTSCSASSRQRAVRHPRERAARHRASLTSAARGLPVSSSCGTHIVDRAEGPGPEADPLPGSWLSPTAVGAASALGTWAIYLLRGHRGLPLCWRAERRGAIVAGAALSAVRTAQWSAQHSTQSPAGGSIAVRGGASTRKALGGSIAVRGGAHSYNEKPCIAVRGGAHFTMKSPAATMVPSMVHCASAQQSCACCRVACDTALRGVDLKPSTTRCMVDVLHLGAGRASFPYSGCAVGWCCLHNGSNNGSLRVHGVCR